MTIQIKPLAAAIGATVEGIDLVEPVSGGDGRLLRDALDDYALLVFPNQQRAGLAAAEPLGGPQRR